jgi:hypothetical protein
MCTRRGSISGAALASSPLWPRCAAIQPGNLRFGGGEALSHDAQSDALRLSEKSEKSDRDHPPSESLPGLHPGLRTRASSLRQKLRNLSSVLRISTLTASFRRSRASRLRGVAPRAAKGSAAFFVLLLN